MEEPPELEVCLTCLQSSANVNLFNISASNDEEHSATIANALAKHFWFTENDFKRGFICESCWQQVDSFHRFYSTVEELHRNLVVKSVPVDAQPEPEVEDVEYLDESFVDLEEDSGKIKQDESNLDQRDVEVVPEFPIQDESENHDDEMPLPVHQETDAKSREALRPRTFCQLPYKTMLDRLREDEYIKQHVKYTCGQCEEESVTFTLFLKHALEAHGNMSAFVACCGKRYYTKVRLHQHVQAINNPEAFRCEPCRKNYGDAEGIKRHRKEFHASEAEKVFRCERCDKSFVLEYKYKGHMKEHDDWDSQSCKCEHCGKM